MPERFKLISEVSLVLIRDGKVCLLRRCNTGYADGQYCYIAGHKDEGESATSAMAREALEEAGIRIDPAHLTVAHVMHRNDSGERIAFFFTPSAWEGEPVNKEPHLHDDMGWFPVDSPPENLIPYMRHALECIRKGISYSEFGW